jgi:hypothetical protein
LAYLLDCSDRIPYRDGWRFSEPFRQVFDIIFSPVWMHVLMHFLLFAGLCVLLIPTFRLQLSACSKTVTLCVVFEAGLLQEGFQALNQETFPVVYSIDDYGLEDAKSNAYWAS